MAILDGVAIFTTGLGILYLYIARVVGKRRVEGDAKGAQTAFLVWWYGLGISQLLGALQIGMFRLDSLSVALYSVFAQINLLLVMAALGGLLYYLVYLYTGNRAWLWRLAAAYAVMYAWLVWLNASHGAPESIVDGGWGLEAIPQVTYTTTELMVLLIGLIGPQIGAALAYILLVRRLDDPGQKYRAGMVGGAIIVWFGIALISSVVSAVAGSNFTDSDAYEVFTRIIGLGAVLAMLFAYRPPEFIQHRYGVEPV